MKQKRLLAALLCSLPSFSYANNDLGEEITVTATRSEQPLNQALSHTTVLNTSQIAASGAADLPTLLRKQAGVEITQSGGIGAQSSLFLRGSNSTHTLVLLDGVRLGSATTGATAIDQIMLDQVERIEIVRGNVSSLYGSDAIGGVIQIFTKRGHGAPAFNASTQIGSHNTQRASAGLGGESGENAYGLQLSSFKTNGVSAINPAIRPAPFPGFPALGANPNNNGYDNQSVSGNLSHRFNADHSLSASLFASQGRLSTDNAFGLPTDINNSRDSLSKFALASDNHFSERWVSHMQLSQGGDDLKSYTNGVNSSSFRTANRELGWQNDITLDETSKLLLGANTLEQKVASSTAYSRTSRRVNSLYGGYTGLFGAHQLQANLRQDRYSDFGTANTGLLGYGYSFDDNWRASASYSTAFKAPIINDLFWPFQNFGGPTYVGNPNLQPEKSHNLEAGLHYTSRNQHLDLTYFDNRISNLIVYNNQLAGTMINLGKAHITGIELGYSAQFGDTAVSAALTVQNPRDALTGQRLLRRARTYGNLGLTQALGAWKLGGEVQFSDARPDNHLVNSTPVALDGYKLLNLSAAYALDKQLNVALRADNLTNRNYALLHGYNTLGRTVSINLNWQQ
ncbi:MAG: TonB-dependent receptor [Nitrosomonadales bacterium]|nr:TonB-dependent receptor [Nitrosomonadales bacterium]